MLPQHMQDARLAKLAENGQSGWLWNAGALDEIARLEDRAVEKRVQHRDGVRGPRHFGNTPLHVLVKVLDCSYPRCVASCLLHHSIEKELNPSVPVAALADAPEASVIDVPVLLQIFIPNPVD